MKNSLNGLFLPESANIAMQDTFKQKHETKPPTASQAPEKVRKRRERGDKKKDIKFPVTPEQRMELRRLAKEMKIEKRDPSKKYETISNTHVLKQAYEQYQIFPERYPALVYRDTGQYMHAEPPLRDYEQIEALAMKWNLSLRKTIHRLIMNYLFRGEVDFVANRQGK